MLRTNNRKQNETAGVPRRDFLHSATVAAVTGAITVAHPTVSGQTRASGIKVAGANDRIRIGLIGSGGMGRGDLTQFLAQPDVDCPVVCDVDDAMSAQGAAIVEKTRGRRPEVTRDFRRVLDRSDIDAVVVATPDHWHAMPTVMACQAGKDVYVEKPFATSIAEGRAMVVAGKKHERVIQMGSQWRSRQHVIDAADFVRSGKLGKVTLVRAWAYLDIVGCQSIGNPPDGPSPASVDYDLWLGPAPERAFNPNRFHFNFRWFWDYAGGLMTDWGVHLLGMALLPMPTVAPNSASCSGGKFSYPDDAAETPDTQIAAYEFPSYLLVWEHKKGSNNGLNGRSWGIEWKGTNGSVVLDPSGWEITPEQKQSKAGSEKMPGSPEPRPAHIRNFLNCMRTRQQPVYHPEQAHHVTSIAHLGNIAYRSKHKISWDAGSETVVGDKEANRLTHVEYRRPWVLPYMK